MPGASREHNRVVLVVVSSPGGRGAGIAHQKCGRVDARARQRLGIRAELIEDDRSQEILARLAAAGLGAHLSAALKGLPEGQRRALDARIVRELDYPSVAAELQCTEPNARALVARGLRTLNATLDGAEP